MGKRKASVMTVSTNKCECTSKCHIDSNFLVDAYFDIFD